MNEVKQSDTTKVSLTNDSTFRLKQQAIEHLNMAIDFIFPCWAPNWCIEEWQLGQFFIKIPRSLQIKVPIYRHFRGVGRELSAPPCDSSPHRPTLLRQLPRLVERNM